MQGMFTKRGHTVDCVEDGAQAVTAVKARAYDVIVMDMHMPVMDGATATKVIRSLPVLAAKIPIIALTAGLTVDERAAYVAAGVDQIVAKPAEWQILFAAIEGRGHAFSQVIGQDVTVPAEGLLDEKMLSDLENAVGAEEVARMLVTMRENLDAYHFCLKQAVAAQDLPAARKVGHGFKGTSYQFGAVELGRVGETFEAASNTLNDLEEALPQIAPALARFDAAIAARTPG